MRISDWSSDVCSSDLACRLRRKDTENPWCRDECVQRFQRTGTVHCSCAHRSGFSIRPAYKRHPCQAECAEFSRRAKGCLHIQYCRSEEHTSELQSLMRISYAVFCLKKKNKTHNKTQSLYN